MLLGVCGIVGTILSFVYSSAHSAILFSFVTALTRWDLELSIALVVVLPVRIQPCVVVQPVLSD